jgi:putative FmdB family regulatory protein
VPLYEYQCARCGRFEVIRKFSDEPLVTCPTCGGEIQKLFSAPAIQFKGTGWYITDYARKSTGGEAAGKGGSKSGEGGSTSSGAKDGGGGKDGGASSKDGSSSKDSSSASTDAGTKSASSTEGSNPKGSSSGGGSSTK